MKATLSFNLPEEKYEFESAVNGTKYRGIMWDINEAIRAYLKHGEITPDASIKLLEEIRSELPNDPE